MKSHYSISIKAPKERIFPLLCPVLEEEWIDGWTPKVYSLLKSESGFVELGSLFVENSLMKFLFGEEGLTAWKTTLYEPFDRQDFTLYLGDRAVIHRAISLDEGPDGTTRTGWMDTVYFLKNPPGAAGALVFRVKLSLFSLYLGRILKYYCEKGRKLALPVWLRNNLFRPLPPSFKDSK